MKFEILVSLKSEVLDPEARAILHAFKQKNYDHVEGLQISRRFVVDLKESDEAAGLQTANRLAKDFLANSVSEQFSVKLVR